MENLYCYKMTWDVGFAPNPYEGVLTLATCKPTIRRCAKVGDWISGWTAREVHDKMHQIRRFDGDARLIYIAKIKDKLTFAEYWKRYPEKRPKPIGKTKIVHHNCAGINKREIKWNNGDNIYKPLIQHPQTEEDYEQITNADHTSSELKHDLSGKYVLICEEFYYFGVENCLSIDRNIFHKIFPNNVPRCKKIGQEDSRQLIEHITDKYPIGIIK